MKKFDGEEKRVFPRIPVCAQVRIKGEEGVFKYYYTRDLSANGVFLISEEPLATGTDVEIDISIPFVRNLLVVEGKVVRIDDYKDKESCRHIKGFAVRFTRIADDDLEYLKKMAASLGSGIREM